MGQTLTNGVYLPDEGERNCYAGLAANWRIVDGHVGDMAIHVTYEDKSAWNNHIADTVKHVTAEDKEAWNGKADASALTAHTGDTTIHVTAADKEAWNGKADASALTAHTGDTTIHVTAADKEAWNGKADASALTAHTGDTTIHVTAEDKTKWDAVTNKANDTDVLHKTGDETAAGIKTFSDETYITSLNFTRNVASPNASSSSILPIINTITYTSSDQPVTARYNFRVTAAGEKSFYPHENNQYSLGLASRRHKDFYTYRINSNNPGSLSLPDLSVGVDISSYITNLNKVVNTFTPPADGWIFIRVRKSSLDHVSIRMQQQNGLISSTETEDFSTWGCSLPVIANKSVDIYIYADAIVSAYFYPCLGNI